MIGSKVGYELLLMFTSLVWRMVRASREITETFPAVRSIPLHPFDDGGARGSEDSPGKGGILSIGKEEFDHRSANGSRVLRISDTLIV
jgi:hypothetical protein